MRFAYFIGNVTFATLLSYFWGDLNFLMQSSNIKYLVSECNNKNINNIHTKISRFWLAKSNAVFKKYDAEIR